MAPLGGSGERVKEGFKEEKAIGTRDQGGSHFLLCILWSFVSTFPVPLPSVFLLVFLGFSHFRSLITDEDTGCRGCS